MSEGGPSPLPALEARLRDGVAADQRDAVRASLGLGSEAGDQRVARALVQAVYRHGLSQTHLSSAGEDRGDDRPEPSRVFETRSSYLMRLSTGTAEHGMDLARLDDLRTLGAVMRAGTLRQRRAAVQRLGELLQEPRGKPTEQVRAATESLVHMRKFELAYELSNACAKLPGAEGRRARAGRKEWDRLVEEVTPSVLSFWEGQMAEEPILALHGDQRAQLLARTRELPPLLIAHLGAVLEGIEGVTDIPSRRAMLTALRDSGDPRLLPSLRAVLESDDTELAPAAARALGRVDDPRVHTVLKRAYGRAVRAELRLALSAALGMVGDVRGLAYVREVAAEGEPRLVPAALAALDHVGTYDDVQMVNRRLLDPDPTVATAAARTLGRIGDSRALLPLSRLAARTDRSALRAEIEESRAAVTARMELLGEEPPPDDAAEEALDTTDRAAMVQGRDPAWVRVRARWSLLLGYFFLAVGMRAKAVGSFEAAAAMRQRWLSPLIALALAYGRRDAHAQTLAAFRRALQVDRRAVERHPTAIRHLARAFLRRAEVLESAGRAGVAFGLLEEALSLDLRRAPSGLRFALGERHEALKARML